MPFACCAGSGTVPSRLGPRLLPLFPCPLSQAHPRDHVVRRRLLKKPAERPSAATQDSAPAHGGETKSRYGVHARNLVESDDGGALGDGELGVAAGGGAVLDEFGGERVPCRKSNKYAWDGAEHLCPECRAPMVVAGHDFAAPRRGNKSGWAAVAAVLAAGLRYEGFGTCGCGRQPEFRPRTSAGTHAATAG